MSNNQISYQYTDRYTYGPEININKVTYPTNYDSHLHGTQLLSILKMSIFVDYKKVMHVRCMG